MPTDLGRSFAVTVVAVGMGVTAGCGIGPSDVAEPLADIATARVSAENGIDQLEPAAALDAVIDALYDEGSFSVTGAMVRGVVIDITYLVDEGAVGTVGDVTDDSGPVELVAVDGRIYVTGDEEFLAETVGEDAAKTIAGKWLMLAEDSSRRFEVLADGRHFTEAVLGGQDGELEMTGVREVDGTPAVGLLFRETGATLWVAASGDPVPLRFEEKGASGGSGVLRFVDLGVQVELEVPDEDDVVDAESLSTDSDE
ncbi:MAG TPA: hypothetical protein VK925_03075 [Jiangellaceae bacterium]|nr:hypothetical protein [Jiangellaceae bacterium]